MNRSKIPVAEYQQYAKQFNPVKYNADAWVKMAKDAYTKAHKGHWDPAQETSTMAEYIDNSAVPQVREMLTNYGEVAVLWWDTPTDMTDDAATKLQSLLSLQQAINNARPCDRIIVTNGVYTTGESILIKSPGTASQPITIEAEKTGGVEINGTNGFMVSSPSSYIIIKGFKFTHKTGTNRIEPGATHCLITRNVFECALAGSPGSKPYLNISGDDNKISYNIFQNKKDAPLPFL